jgi:hypothetical protein
MTPAVAQQTSSDKTAINRFHVNVPETYSLWLTPKRSWHLSTVVVTMCHWMSTLLIHPKLISLYALQSLQSWHAECFIAGKE